MNKILFLTVIVFLATFPSFGQVTPDFSSYPATVRQTKSAKINVKSHSLAKKYRKQLSEASKRTNNFAGKYILSGWNCGKNCMQFAIIDAESGMIFFPVVLQNISFNPSVVSAQKLIEYQPDSRLLVLNLPNAGKTNGQTSQPVKIYFEWDNTELKEIKLSKSIKGIVSRIVLPEFESPVSILKTETEVPILLPSRIPDPKFLPKIIPLQEGSSGLTFYSGIFTSSKTEYDLSIDITRDCKGRPNCNYGHIIGVKNTSTLPASISVIEFNSRTAQPVVLANGINGFYIPAPTDPKATRGAQIVWLDGKGNQYAVSLKRGFKEDVVSMANSMIDNYYLNN